MCWHRTAKSSQLLRRKNMDLGSRFMLLFPSLPNQDYKVKSKRHLLSSWLAHSRFFPFDLVVPASHIFQLKGGRLQVTPVACILLSKPGQLAFSPCCFSQGEGRHSRSKRGDGRSRMRLRTCWVQHKMVHYIQWLSSQSPVSVIDFTSFFHLTTERGFFLTSWRHSVCHRLVGISGRLH